MEFDKRRIYTCVNADELKIGDTVIVGDDLEDLENNLQNGCRFGTIEGIGPTDTSSRFEVSCSNYAWRLAYLIEEAPAKIKKCYSIVKCRKCENPLAKEILFYTNDIFISKDRAIEYCEKLNVDATREQGTFFDAVVADLFTEE